MSTTVTGSAKAADANAANLNDDLEKLLDREALVFKREMEVSRIIKAFKLNPYDILDIEHTVTTDAIKRKYRQLSLFIHPDKTPDPRAPEAFDLLKKAEAELGDEKKRESLDAAIKEARILVLRSMNLPQSITDDDDRLKHELPAFREKVKAKSKEVLIEEEVRRRTAIKVNLANEGTEQRMKEAEISERKRKAEEDAQWEVTREGRVGNWRSFAGKPKKKKKTAGLLG